MDIFLTDFLIPIFSDLRFFSTNNGEQAHCLIPSLEGQVISVQDVLLLHWRSFKTQAISLPISLHSCSSFQSIGYLISSALLAINQFSCVTLGWGLGRVMSAGAEPLFSMSLLLPPLPFWSWLGTGCSGIFV